MDMELYARQYSLDDFLKVVEIDGENQYELVDGQIHMMASPSVTLQRLTKSIADAFSEYFKKSNCEVFISPLDVLLIDEYAIHKPSEQRYVIELVRDKKGCINVYQPDVFVVCDKEKIKEKGIEGAPDLVVEVVSKSSAHKDCFLKYGNYMKYGVKEYWVVNYELDQILVYLNVSGNGKEVEKKAYKMNDLVKSRLFDGLQANFGNNDFNI